MNKAIPIVMLCTAAVLTTLLLNGCDNKVASSSAKAPKPLVAFLSLHKQFCEKKYDDSFSLKETLSHDKKLAPAKDFNGVYEVFVNKVSYAISPEDDGCTTDVMVQADGSQELFTFDDINKALISSGYIATGDAKSRKDMGLDQSEVMVIQKKYISPQGEVTTLDFPLNKKDKYYMTLFAEKFTQAKREIKEKVMNKLRMASIKSTKSI
jgi:hypothetical protein